MLLLLLAGPRDTEGFAQSVRVFFLLGLPGLGLAALLRMWARGYKRQEGFVLDGPYRHVRNPVELGALVGFAGAGVVMGMRWWFNFACLGGALVYISFVSMAYERQLYAQFGSVYLRYAQRVRRWWPSRLPAVNSSKLTYSLGQAFRQEFDSVLWLVGLGIVFALRKRYNI